MALAIGIVKSIVGIAMDTNAKGQDRVLKVGDAINVEDTIDTLGAASQIVLALTDGQELSIGGNDAVFLDKSVYGTESFGNDAVASSEIMKSILPGESIADIQQALLKGEDVSNLAATAAGNTIHPIIGTSGEPLYLQGGHESSIHSSLRDSSGTQGNHVLFAAAAPTESNAIPTISVDTDTHTVLESGLSNGTDPSIVHTTTAGTFTVGDPDGLNDIHSISVAGTVFTIGSGAGEFANLGSIVGQTVDTSHGKVTITGHSNGIFDYSYVLDAPVSNNIAPATNTNGQDNLNIIVTDRAGTSAQGTVTINITDDVPTISTTQSDSTYEFTMTNHDAVSSAGYHNSYGYYVKDANGDPTHGVVIWSDVHQDPTAQASISGYSPEQVGFFIIPNGQNDNSFLTDNTAVTFQKVNGEWEAAVTANNAVLSGNGSHVLFDVANLNQDGQDHLQDNALIGNQNWEDLQIPAGDGDYNDVNINVAWTQGPLSVDETYLNTPKTSDFSSNFTSNYGADGPAGSMTYGLNIQSGHTGLLDTETHSEVQLKTVGGVVEGYVTSGGVDQTVFTLNVNANDGKVTLDQMRAVVHGDPTNPNDFTGIDSHLISLSATITDGDGDTATNSIDIGSTIRFADDAPMATNDAANLNEDHVSYINVLANDSSGSDGYATKNPIHIIGNPTHGSAEVVTHDGHLEIKYTPDANYSGKDSINYSITDKDGDQAMATVAVHVNPVADAPGLIMSAGLMCINDSNTLQSHQVQPGGYEYDLRINAKLMDTDGSESLIHNQVIIPKSSLDGAAILADPSVTQDANNYYVHVSDGVDSMVTLQSHTLLSVDSINAITGSVTSIESVNSDTATTTTTALFEMSTSHDGIYTGTHGNDLIEGNHHDNQLYGNGGNDILNGNGGNDILQGGAGNDLLIGGRGDDTLVGGNGQDSLYGLSGNDTLVYDSHDIIADGGLGTDTLLFQTDATVDLSQIVGNVSIKNMEMLDLTHANVTIANLNANDILDMTDSHNIIKINGDSGDTVHSASAWSQPTDQTGVEAGYTRYMSTATASDSSTHQVFVDIHDTIVHTDF